VGLKTFVSINHFYNYRKNKHRFLDKEILAREFDGDDSFSSGGFRQIGPIRAIFHPAGGRPDRASLQEIFYSNK
jgi:hypothetical protein